MAKRTRSPALSRAQKLALRRVKKRTDKVYRNFWLAAMAIRPPRPPKIEPLLRSLGTTIDAIAMILRPPKPPK